MNTPLSLRRRLLVWILSVVGLAWLVVAASGYFAARHELDELLDAHLAQTAGILAAQVTTHEHPMAMEPVPPLHRYAVRVAFQVWEGQQLRLHSATAPSSPLSDIEDGFATATVAGTCWRVFSASVRDSAIVVKVAERLDARDEVSEEVAEHLAMPLTIALPILGVLILITVDRSLKPLTALAQQVAARDPQRLEVIPEACVPTEVRPLVTQLNALFMRIQQSLDSERRFTADASHELRTPIAGIRAQAQVARAAAEEGERQRALDQMLLGCDRAAQVVEQLLTLARLDADAENTIGERCDLRAVVQSVLAALGPWAHQSRITLEFHAEDVAEIIGNATLASILVRNLVDNAIRYSPPETTVTVRLAKDVFGANLEVVDCGPGIPVLERKKVFQRFYRVASASTGSGLGLSIAWRITQLMGAELSLADAEKESGLKVMVRFPSVEAAF